jgi:hypothetical protein
MATTPSLTTQAAQAQRELAIATKTLAAAQNTVIAAQKAGRTPSPAALAAVEAATTAVKSTQLASNNATAAVTSAAGKTPPATGPGVPNSLAAAGNQNGGVSPLIDPANKQQPYNVSTPSPRSGSMLNNSSGLLNTLGAAALGAAAANPLATLALASRIGGIFKSTKDVLPASTAVPKSTPAVNPATSGTGFGDDQEEFTTDSQGNTFKAGQLFRAAEVDDTTGTGFGDDQEEFTTDSQGNTFKAGQLFRAAEVDEEADNEFGNLEAAQAAAADRAPDTQSPEDIQAGLDDAFANQLQEEEGISVADTSPNEVDPGEDPELQEPPGTDPVFTELAEPPDPDADPELLAGPEEEEPYTDLAEPVDPDADPELEQLAGPDNPPGTGFGDDQEEFTTDSLGNTYRDGALFRAAEVDDTTGTGFGDDQEEFTTDSRGNTFKNGTLFRAAEVDESDPATSGTGFGDDEGDAALFDQRAAEDRAAQKQATLDQARAQNTIANQRKNSNNADWRVKLRLAPQANYLYAAPNPGILAPLKAQGGVIFPYTPSITTGYKATYSSYDLTHSNYKGYYYQNSSVDAVTLSCPFTAQSTVEAEYLLAVIHFFKSVTKMFYGQDAERGTPPPLVYLTGLGEYQFNEHPCVVQSFTYELPTDVDYIRARSPNINNSNMLQQRQSNNGSTVGTTWGGGILGGLLGGAINRLANAGLPKGGTTAQPAPNTLGLNSPTYVPTKINLSISLLPVQSRQQQSQNFSLRQYANGDLLKGGFW